MFRGSEFAPALFCVLAILIVGCGKTNSGAGPTPATADAEKVVNLYICRVLLTALQVGHR